MRRVMAESTLIIYRVKVGDSIFDEGQETFATGSTSPLREPFLVGLSLRENPGGLRWKKILSFRVPAD